MSKAIGSVVSKDFMPSAMSQVAIGIDYCVFGSHNTMIRNQHGSEARMQELFRFGHKVAGLIDEGFLKNSDSVMKYLRDMWKRKHTPKIFRK